MKSLLVFPFLFVVGCSTSVAAPVMLPDGSNGAVVNCRYRTQCLQMASRACAGAYTVLSMEDNNPHVVDQNGENSYLVPADDFNPSKRGTDFVIRCNPHRGDGS